MDLLFASSVTHSPSASYYLGRFKASLNENLSLGVQQSQCMSLPEHMWVYSSINRIAISMYSEFQKVAFFSVWWFTGRGNMWAPGEMCQGTMSLWGGRERDSAAHTWSHIPAHHEHVNGSISSPRLSASPQGSLFLPRPPPGSEECLSQSDKLTPNRGPGPLIAVASKSCPSEGSSVRRWGVFWMIGIKIHSQKWSNMSRILNSPVFIFITRYLCLSNGCSELVIKWKKRAGFKGVSQPWPSGCERSMHSRNELAWVCFYSLTRSRKLYSRFGCGFKNNISYYNYDQY